MLKLLDEQLFLPVEAVASQLLKLWLDITCM